MAKTIIQKRVNDNPLYTGPEYNSNEIALINTSEIPTTIRDNSAFELHFYLPGAIAPFNSNYNWQNYNILSNDFTISNIEIEPSKDIESISGLLTFNNYTLTYNFYNNLCGTSEVNQLYIDSISSDRTELILKPSFTNNTTFASSAYSFIYYRENTTEFRDFYLNLSENRLLLCTNIALDDTVDNNPLLFIKLYEPLPDNYERLQNLWIVQKIADTVSYDVQTFDEPFIDQSTQYLAGPNININLNEQVNNSTPFLTKNQLTPTTSSFFLNQIDNLLSSSDLSINVDYNDFSNFINYSSPTIRLQNFYVKVSLLESYQNELNSLSGVASNSGSINLYQSRIDSILQNFDGYDKFLYYESGSRSWPKTNSTYPYTLQSTGSAEVLEWYGAFDPASQYYGGQLLSASQYDITNKNYLLYSIPQYLRDDPANAPYETFVSMIGQHFDNIWIYTKDITNKFDGDNRINFGISKDLVSDAIKEFGIKLYQNNFTNTDLFSAFFGIPEDNNPTGLPGVFYESLYYGLGTWGGSIYGPLPAGSEGVRTVISASNDIIPVDDINKRIYKRIYHNSPFLVKSKGTKRGLETLINCFGVPDSILQINEFGGKDKVRENDWDFYRRIYNKEIYKEGDNSVVTIFANTGGGGLNQKWGIDPVVPRTIEFRFKSRTNPNTLPDCTNFTNTPIREELFHLNTGNAQSASLFITLEYFGSGSVSSSYSGSTFDTNNQYADLTLYISGSTQHYSSSINLPFYNQDWWNVMLQYDSGSNKFNLNTGNKIYNGNDGTKLGFTGSTSITVPTYADTETYRSSSAARLVPRAGANKHFGSGKSGSINFSGSVQELRYWTNLLTETSFHNHVMNPLSIETGYITGSLSPVETLAFRTREGEDLSVTGGTNISIHPKVTGSYPITSSFSSSGVLGFNSIYTDTGTYNGNKEFQFLNQPIAGIKNRINDKIRVENLEFPEGNTLTYYRPLQQNNEASRSFTDHTNYTEIGFSPSNQINDDIIAQFGQLNIGEYIGDPRHRSSSLDYYQDLNNLRNEYFEKYIRNYDVNDFVRLIKYFDNSLFKMIKDFIPLRGSTSTGIIIKQHLLERNKYPQPKTDPFTVLAKTPETGSTIKGRTQTGNNSELIFKDISVEGVMKSTARGYTTGSSIIVVSGSTGGSFNQFNGLNNRFGFTQSFSESYITPSGSSLVIRNNQREFYDGEFSGSTLVVTTQSLNLGENAFDFGNAPTAEDFRLYKYIFTSSITPTNTFENTNNIPPDGSIFFLVENFRIQKIRAATISQSIDIKNLFENKTRINFNQFGLSVNVSQDFVGPGYVDYTVQNPYLNAFLLNLGTSNTASFYASGSDTAKFDNKFKIDCSIQPNGSFGYRGTDIAFQTSVSEPLFFANTWGATTDPHNLLSTNPNDGYNSPFLSNKSIFISSSIGDTQVTCSNTTVNQGRIDFYHYLMLRSPQGTDLPLVRKGPIRLELSASSTVHGSLGGLLVGYDDFKEINMSLPDDLPFVSGIQQNLYQGAKLVNEVVGFYSFGFPVGGGEFTFTGSLTDYTLYISGSTSLNDNDPTIEVINTEPITGVSNLSELQRNADALPLFNNVSDNNDSSFYYDLDYTQGGLTPTNITGVINQNATRVQTPDSNYSQKSRILPRYNGVKATSLYYNIYSPPGTEYYDNNVLKSWQGDKSYGQLPVIDYTKPFFAYFKLLLGTSPELENATQVKIDYIIDKQGRPFKPLDGTPAFYNVEGTYETNDTVTIALENSLQQDDPSLTNAAAGINLDTFNSSSNVIRGARRVDPIVTNQILSINDTGSVDDAFASILTFDSPIDETRNFSCIASTPTSSLTTTNDSIFRSTNFQRLFFKQVLVDEDSGFQLTDGEYVFQNSPAPGNRMVFHFGAENPDPNSPIPNLPINIRTTNNDVINVPIPNVATIRIMRDSPSLGTTGEVLGERNFDFIPMNGLFSLPNIPAYYNLGASLQYGNFQTSPREVFEGDKIYVEIQTGISTPLITANGSVPAGIFEVVLDFQGFAVRPQDFPISFLQSSIDPFWKTGSNFSTYLTSSTSMSRHYNNVKYIPPTGSTFKPTNEIFNIRIGDQFRFMGSENLVYTAVEDGIISTQGATSGSIIVKVNPPVRPEVNLNQFLIRRFNKDGSSVLIDLTPPSSSFATTKGYIKSKYINQELEENINSIISNLIDRGIIQS